MDIRGSGPLPDKRGHSDSDTLHLRSPRVHFICLSRRRCSAPTNTAPSLLPFTCSSRVILQPLQFCLYPPPDVSLVSEV